LSHLDIAVPLEIELGKAANIPSPRYPDSEVIKKSTIAGAHEGNENQSMNGVVKTETISCMKMGIFIAKSSPSSW
jgi:hypothetical protein